MSACIVLNREGAFGKRVVAALNERLAKNPPAPAEEEQKPMEDGEEEKKPEKEEEKKSEEGETASK